MSLMDSPDFHGSHNSCLPAAHNPPGGASLATPSPPIRTTPKTYLPCCTDRLNPPASLTKSLDRYSHWIPSMGRHAADGMDEALELSLLLTKPSTRTSCASRFYGICRQNEKPTSGLEPLTIRRIVLYTSQTRETLQNLL